MQSPKETERLPLTSADPVAERVARLRELFPEAGAEGKFDVEKLRAILGGEAAAGPERYGLSWAGKSDAIKAIQTLTTATLLPVSGESEKWDATGNAIIEGDNLEVLKVLQHAYYGKVKLIYIDPPYNTGGDFIYPDDYAEGLGSYLRFTRQVNEEGAKLTTNVDSSGRYHSRWLTMMYPRLFLARNLLREDGVIFVSIDDHEVSNLRLLMDEIFGEENFLATFVRRRRLATGMREDPISPDHEYLACYARQAESAKLFGAARNPEDYPFKDDVSSYRSTDLSVGMTKEMRPNQFYAIKNPESGQEYWPPEGRVWRFEPNKMESHVDAQNIIWPESNSRMSRPRFKTRYFEGVEALSPISTWIAGAAGETGEEDGVLTLQAGLNQEGTKELRELFGEQVLEYPKPVSLLKLVVAATTRKDDVILDFFAGSGTTAQAVLEMNEEDCGGRRFLLVQLPEPTGRTDFATIADITKERVRRSIKAIESGKDGQLPMDAKSGNRLGFKVFKLAESNFAIWDPALAANDPEKLAEQWTLSAENVQAGAPDAALLCELMLKNGLPFDAPIETKDARGAGVHLVEDSLGGRVLICVAKELTREQLRAMAEMKPQSVVCLDIAFKGNDALKVNAQLEFESHGIRFRTA